jgi:hypothetical protein
MRVLIVAFYFPPAGGGGVQRTLKFCKFLPEHGVEVHVLTPYDPKWFARDEHLLEAIPATTTVHYTVTTADDPSVTIAGPEDGATYEEGQQIAADYSCKDEGSGVASCVGTVANNHSIDTSTVGTHTFTVQAEDNAGNTASKTVSYDVVYNVWTGFGSPINDGGVTTRTAGSTLPVHFGIGGNFGLGILAAGYPRSQQVSCSTGAPIGPATPTASNDGLTFSNGQYAYDWKTDKAWKGTCRNLIIKLNDNTVRTALISFK